MLIFKMVLILILNVLVCYRIINHILIYFELFFTVTSVFCLILRYFLNFFQRNLSKALFFYNFLLYNII